MPLLFDAGRFLGKHDLPCAMGSDLPLLFDFRRFLKKWFVMSLLFDFFFCKKNDLSCAVGSDLPLLFEFGGFLKMVCHASSFRFWWVFEKLCVMPLLFDFGGCLEK